MTSKELAQELVTDFKAFTARPDAKFSELELLVEGKVEKFRIEHVGGMREKCAKVVEERAACAAEIRALPI